MIKFPYAAVLALGLLAALGPVRAATGVPHPHIGQGGLLQQADYRGYTHRHNSDGTDLNPYDDNSS